MQPVGFLLLLVSLGESPTSLSFVVNCLSPTRTDPQIDTHAHQSCVHIIPAVRVAGGSERDTSETGFSLAVRKKNELGTWYDVNTQPFLAHSDNQSLTPKTDLSPSVDGEVQFFQELWRQVYYKHCNVGATRAEQKHPNAMMLLRNSACPPVPDKSLVYLWESFCREHLLQHREGWELESCEGTLP